MNYITDKDAKDIRIGRLEKKIRKLIQQKDFHKERHEYYAKVISMQPYIERRWKNYEERIKEQERVKDLENRVKEQEALIKLLQKSKVDTCEVCRMKFDSNTPTSYCCTKLNCPRGARAF